MQSLFVRRNRVSQRCTLGGVKQKTTWVSPRASLCTTRRRVPGPPPDLAQVLVDHLCSKEGSCSEGTVGPLVGRWVASRVPNFKCQNKIKLGLKIWDSTSCDPSRDQRSDSTLTGTSFFTTQVVNKDLMDTLVRELKDELEARTASPRRASRRGCAAGCTGRSCAIIWTPRSRQL